MENFESSGCSLPPGGEPLIGNMGVCCKYGLAALILIVFQGCSSRDKVLNFTSFHSRLALNGVSERLMPPDSLYIESMSRMRFGTMTLNSRTFVATFTEPFEVTDMVNYVVGVPDETGPHGVKACKVDTGYMAYAKRIPFDISDLLVQSIIPKGNSVSAKWAFSYLIHCGEDRETGEIHMVESFHYETRTIGH